MLQGEHAEVSIPIAQEQEGTTICLLATYGHKSKAREQLDFGSDYDETADATLFL